MINIIGMLGGYIIGMVIWDKIIFPILEKRRKEEERKTFLEYIELCKIIGNPKHSILGGE